ncbi:single-stranded-DNA-specific exonuclease [Chlorella sorokiniana]|uniref:Single-stranded-DNA-specific exonuclease n=1 Tax=Chlorella sorokiniana TaxID=3076 RepID=A0A2P6U325_CHLSO|nr:single-stranded-DNA-specific exonuclease [Chlorella sorokiniana]|eukprot:PRW60715.1 single-stranded-DNA-specific exonuclease [Chlorella sorokiniana]
MLTVSLRAPLRFAQLGVPRRRGLAAAAGGGGREARSSRYSGIVPRQAPAAAGQPAAPPPPPPPRRSPRPAQPPTSQAPPPPQRAPAAAQRPTAQQQAPQAQHRGSHGSQGALQPSDAPIVSSRQWLLGLVPRQQFRVVGVSFDDRQSLIPLLQKDQAVACVREPDNPHDPNAVAVRTLDGRNLGYIPRDRTVLFSQDLCFGHVQSAGRQGEEGLWGFNIVTQPTVPPVEVHAWPAALRPHLNLASQLARDEAWQRLQQDAFARAQGRCEVTSAFLESPAAAVAPRWQCDEPARVLRLVGLRAEAPEVQQVGALLELRAHNPSAAGHAAALLQQLNGWSPADVQLYLAHIDHLAAARSSQQGWRLDLQWLQERGVALPPPLAALAGGR